MVDRYGVGLELLGSEPLQQLIDGFVFQGRPAARTRLDHFGFPLIGTTTNLTLGKLDILRTTHPLGSAFHAKLCWPAVHFLPCSVRAGPGKSIDIPNMWHNTPTAVSWTICPWVRWSNTCGEKTPPQGMSGARRVPHLILTATLEPEKADWTERDDLDKLSWMEIRARATQLRYNGKIDKFQRAQRDIRRIIKQRASEETLMSTRPISH